MVGLLPDLDHAVLSLLEVTLEGRDWIMGDRFWILKRGKLIHSVRKADIDHDTYLSLAKETTMAGVAP